MIAAIDNTFLTLLLDENSTPRPNPATGSPATHCRQRIEALVDDITSKKGTLLIPTPALGEALCSSATTEFYFEELQKYACIVVAPFDARAAFEFGRMIRSSVAAGDKRAGQCGEWQHIKMDRTIVAIALSRSVGVFFTDDQRQFEYARRHGLNVESTWDLDLPASFAQHNLSEHEGHQWPTHQRPPKPTTLTPKNDEK